MNDASASFIKDFLRITRSNKEIDAFFDQFDSDLLFSDSCDDLKVILDHVREAPACFFEYNTNFGMSSFARYLVLSLPKEFTEDYFKIIIRAIDVLPAVDLDFVIPIITSKFNEIQTPSAIFFLPDCGSTFIYLSSLFMSANLFFSCFQRIYSSFYLVPHPCRQPINSHLKRSLAIGPAKNHILEMIDVVISHNTRPNPKKQKKYQGPILDLVLSSIIDTFPESLSETDEDSLQNIFEIITKQPITVPILKFLDISNCQFVLSFEQILMFLSHSPSMLFQYLKRLPQAERFKSWQLIFDRCSTFDITRDNIMILRQIYINFLISAQVEPELIKLLSKSQALGWFGKFVFCMKSNIYEAALFGIYLLVLRFFETISFIAYETTLVHEHFDNSIHHNQNRILFAEVIFWVIDPTKECPFEHLIDNGDLEQIKILPPSSSFLFQILPCLLTSLFQAAIADSIPQDEPQQKTPLRISHKAEATHSKIILKLFEDDPEEDEEVKTIFSSQNEFDYDEQEENTEAPEVFAGDVETLSMRPFLRYIIEHLLPFYDQPILQPYLVSISSTKILLPLLPFAHSDDKCFNFISRALGLSCPFPVFQTFYEQLQPNFKKLLEFFNILADYSQMVTDYLYITTKIGLYLSNTLSIVLWVRPFYDSPLLTLYLSKKIELSLKITENSLIINDKDKTKIDFGPKINGWVMISLVFTSTNLLIISANLSSVKLSYSADVLPMSQITIGGDNAHFDMQSCYTFRTILTDEELLYQFTLGPNHHECVLSDLNYFSCTQEGSFVSETGFISHHYLPYIDHFHVNKKLESNAFNNLEVLLSPPFKLVKQIYRGEKPIQQPIKVDRRRSYSFMNALHCHGGLYLLIHFIGQVILKQPELNSQIWSLLGKLLNNYPSVNQFFETNHAYTLVSHLLWSGKTKAKDTIDLAIKDFNNRYIITNPHIISSWTLEAQIFFCEIDDTIIYLMASLKNQYNFTILKNAKAFNKIVKLLCGPVGHSNQFLSLLGDFALMLTDKESACENAKLVFDKLLLNHLKFSLAGAKEESSIKPLTTVALIRILQLILKTYTEPIIELELFIPAIVTSSPQIQVAIIVLLIQFMSYRYFDLLSDILLTLPYIEGIQDSIFAFLTADLKKITLIQVSTCYTYFASHIECQPSISHLLSFADMETRVLPQQTSIIINQLINTIIYCESQKQPLVFDENVYDFMATLCFKALELNQADETERFFLSLSQIDSMSLHQIFENSFRVLNKMLTLTMKSRLSQNFLDEITIQMQAFGSYMLQKVKLTPGANDEEIMKLIETFTDIFIEMVIKANNSDSAQRIVYYLIILFHFDLSSDYLCKIKQELQQIPKLSKQKRYAEMIERMEDNSSLPPTKFEIVYDKIEDIEKFWKDQPGIVQHSLFSLTCRSIFFQTKDMMTTNDGDNECDDVIDLWHSIFSTLHFPGSCIYKNCPTKWKVSDRSSSYQQRSIIIPINPSIDKIYPSFWEAKYATKLPQVVLTLQEVLQYTPLTFQNANNVRYSSHAIRVSGISNYDGVVVVTSKAIRFYQRNKTASASVEDLLIIPMSKLLSVQTKSYRHQPTGVELNCKNYQNYMFAFDATNIRDLFIDELSALGINHTSTFNNKELQEMTKKWSEGNLSNFDYLLYLNMLSGRSWNDFTQYPIIPWIIKDYSSDTIDLNDESIYRDLSYPIFAQNEDQRIQCQTYYKTTSVLSNNPHCTPNYISNVGSTLYFLIRVEPFTDDEIAFQSGSLDAADRTFQSFLISYNLMTTPGNKSALELVPEFYFNPEVLKNVNDIKFPESPLTKRSVGDVVLPNWASSYRSFIRTMRRAIESPLVSKQLHEWIDLTWGFRRRGDSAYERCNVFQSTVFEFNPNDVIDDRVLFKAIRDQIHNCGQAAQQLFKQPHPKKTAIPTLIKGDLVQSKQKVIIDKSMFRLTRGSDRWYSLTSEKIAIKGIRLNQGQIEFFKNNTITVGFAFTEEIQATCIDVAGLYVATGHEIPLVNIWKIKDDLELVASLRCHLSKVTAVSFFTQHEKWQMLAAGHDDGSVTLFSMNPIQFLRILSTESKNPVSFIRTCSSNGDILVIQKELVTLWSVNGEMVNSLQMETEVIDATFSSFTEGTNDNFIILLCEDQKLYMLNTNELDVTSEVVSKREGACAVVTQKDSRSLCVAHNDGAITIWTIL